MLRIRTLIPAFAVIVMAPFVDCSAAEAPVAPQADAQAAGADLSPEDATAIARDAYVFGFPLVMNLKTIYDYVIDVDSSNYRGPFNEVSCEARVFTPQDTAVVTPNADTPYCIFWMDLRNEPQVITVPDIEAERYYSVQLIDFYTHNFGYVGTRTNDNRAGTYLLTGPGWGGDAPEGITEVLDSETDLIFAVIRTQLFDANDLERVKEIQDAFSLQPLSAFTGQEVPSAAPDRDFPRWVDGSEFSIAAFDYLDVALDLVDTHPDDAALTTRFAQIGMGTPDRFDSNELAPALAAALGEGQRHGLDEMRGLVASMADDPLGSAKVFGTRAFLEETARSLGHPNLYLPRSTAAMIGLYGNSGEEAIYPTYLADADGDPLDASEHEYVMTFPAGELPPARAFWSLTMYDGQTQLFIENPLDRYLLSSTMSEQFVRAEDGSIVFSIQKDSPGGEQEANWLPAPDGPFYLVLRLYLPEQRVLDGKWTPSALTKVQ